MPFPFFSKSKGDSSTFAIITTLIAGVIIITKNKEAVARMVANLFKYATDKSYRFRSTQSSDSLFNKNCFHYLVKINEQLPERVLNRLPEELSHALQQYCVNGRYDRHVAYGNIYKAFFEQSEDLLAEMSLEHSEELASLIQAIYDNDNGALERTYRAIKPRITQAQSLTDLREAVYRTISFDDTTSHNDYPPSYHDTYLSKGINVAGSHFKPQHTTGIACLRRFRFSDALPFTEYRFGTQAQRHQNIVRVSPLFNLWVHQQQPREDQVISHIYFNNLALDRTSFEGKKERELTEKLHQLEHSHEHLAVITLPADKGLLSNRELASQMSYPLRLCSELFLNIALDKDTYLDIHDLHISPKIRRLLFKDNQHQKGTLKTLIHNSAVALGLSDKVMITARERQALYMYFIKFELTNYIIETLKPRGINFSCKDAIDRAGVSSVIYNLMKSIELGSPMTEDEFQQTLHAAPAMVKGRAMNHHLEKLVSFLQIYVNAQESVPQWLSRWCETTCRQEEPSEGPTVTSPQSTH